MSEKNTSNGQWSQQAPNAGEGSGEPITLAGVLGEIAWVFSQERSHRYMFIADLEWLVMPAVLAGQYRIFRSEEGPVGVALWAYLSETAEKRIAEGLGRIAPAEWRSGNNLWIIDLIAPFGGDEKMIDEMKKTVFRGLSFKYHKVTPDGQRTIVEDKG